MAKNANKQIKFQIGDVVETINHTIEDDGLVGTVTHVQQIGGYYYYTVALEMDGGNIECVGSHLKLSDQTPMTAEQPAPVASSVDAFAELSALVGDHMPDDDDVTIPQSEKSFICEGCDHTIHESDWRFDDWGYNTHYCQACNDDEIELDDETLLDDYRAQVKVLEAALYKKDVAFWALMAEHNALLESQTTRRAAAASIAAQKRERDSANIAGELVSLCYLRRDVTRKAGKRMWKGTVEFQDEFQVTHKIPVDLYGEHMRLIEAAGYDTEQFNFTDGIKTDIPVILRGSPGAYRIESVAARKVGNK